MSKGDEVPDETRLQGVFCTTAHTSGHWRSCLASWDPTSCLGIRFNGKASQTNPLHVLTLTVVLFFCCCYVLMLPKREKTGTEKEKKKCFFLLPFPSNEGVIYNVIRFIVARQQCPFPAENLSSNDSLTAACRILSPEVA